MRHYVFLMIAFALLASCGGNPSAPEITPLLSPTFIAACERFGTATVRVTNNTGESAEVFVDGVSELLLRSGGSDTLIITSGVRHELKICNFSFFKSCCTWNISLPACGNRSFTCN